MNNQFILPSNNFVFIKIENIYKINNLKLFLSLKYIWEVLVAWYLFRREKTKKIWVHSWAQLILIKNQKK